MGENIEFSEIPNGSSPIAPTSQYDGTDEGEWLDVFEKSHVKEEILKGDLTLVGKTEYVQYDGAVKSISKEAVNTLFPIRRIDDNQKLTLRVGGLFRASMGSTFKGSVINPVLAKDFVNNSIDSRKVAIGIEMANHANHLDRDRGSSIDVKKVVKLNVISIKMPVDNKETLFVFQEVGIIDKSNSMSHKLVLNIKQENRAGAFVDVANIPNVPEKVYSQREFERSAQLCILAIKKKQLDTSQKLS